MANRQLTADIIAKAAVAILNNELVMAKKVYRGYEGEFNSVNGYEVGATVSIRRPADFVVTDGATMAVQDVIEGKTSITVDKRKHVAFRFTSQDLSLNIKELGERVMKPALIQLANQIDADLHGLYKFVPNWVGTAGQVIDAFSDFAKGPERLDEYAVPRDSRCGVLSPADHWALVGSQTALYTSTINTPAYREGQTGMVGGVDLYSTQNVATHTVGSDVGGTVDGAITAATIDYDAVKDTMQQTITTSSVNLNPGDVFTIADVNAVNPVTKADLGFAKQFVCISYSSNSLVFYPAMIWDGPQQTVAVKAGVTDLDTKAITAVGSTGTGYRQNMIFRRDAFALCMVPLVAPPGASEVGRSSMDGINVRVIPVYDGVNDYSAWRLDVLYGIKAVDPRQAVRLSGTSSG